MLALAALGVVLWQKGYLDSLLSGAAVAPQAGGSDKMFEKAIRLSIVEAQDKATQRLVDDLKARVEQVVSVPFVAAGNTPQAPPSPAPVPPASSAGP